MTPLDDRQRVTADPIRFARFSVAKVVVLLCSAIAGIAIALSPMLAALWGWRTPDPTASYKRHRGSYAAYVADVRAGKIPSRADGQGHEVPKWLIDERVSYVRSEGECITFSFQSLPSDRIPLLVFSPSGTSGLTFVHWEQIDSQWSFAMRD